MDPRLDVENIRHLDTRVPQRVISVTFPERAFWVLLPAHSHVDVGIAGPGSSAG